MTTYILHGGRTSHQNALNDQFFAHFTESVKKENITILLCYFARPKDTWQALMERDSETIQRTYTKTKKVKILVAESVEDLFTKLSAADVLYMAGGEAPLLEPFYEELRDLPAALAGKVYAGSSMGAFLASQQYVLSSDETDAATVHQGVGLLPIQVLCHWDLENDKEKQAKLTLLQNSSDLPILVLNEYQSVIFYR